MPLPGENQGPATRKEVRIAAVVPVRIYGMDADGKPFGINVATLNISRNGALLSRVEVNLNIGDVIGLQKGVAKAKYRVKWLGKKGSANQGQAGLECMEPTRNVFGVEDSAAVSDVREQAGLQRRTRESGGDRGERRASPRYKCDLGVQVRMEGTEMNLWSRCTDLSEGGCYVESRSPVKVGTKLTVTFFLQPESLILPAIVRTSFPGMGIGLQFQFSSSVESSRLQRFLGEKFGNQRAAASVTAALAGSPITAPGGTPAAPVVPSRVAQVPARPLHTVQFPEMERLEEYIGATLAWAETSGLKEFDRRQLEELALSLRQELQGLRVEIEQRAPQARERDLPPRAV